MTDGMGAQARLLRPRTCGLLVGALGLIVLIGWATGEDPLHRLFPAWNSMKPLTACCFVLLGLNLRWPQSAAMTAWVSLGLAAGILVDGLPGIDSGIGTVIFGTAVRSETTVDPGLPSPLTAVMLASAALALLALRYERPAVASRCALVVGGIATFGTIGNVMGAESLRAFAPYAAFTLHTAIAGLVLAHGLIMSAPRAGLGRLLSEGGSAGTAARRILPMAVLGTSALGWLARQGQYLGWYGSEVGLTIMVSGSMLLLSLTVGAVAVTLRRLDRERLSALVDAQQTTLLLEDRVADATREMETVLRVAPVGLGRATPGGRLGWHNEHWQLLTQDGEEQLASALQAAVRGGGPFRHTIGIPTDGFSPRWVTMAGQPDEDGWITALADVTAERGLADAQARFATAFEHSPMGMVITDGVGHIQQVNRAMLALLNGPDPDSSVGEPIVCLFHHDEEATWAELLAADDTNAVRCELRLRGEGQEQTWVDTSVASLALPDGTRGWLVLANDISSRRDAEQRLTHQTLHDALTGLPNRVLLIDRLGEALARGERSEEPMALFFCDLDHFKDINDSLGHAAGDQLLVVVADRLRDTVRPADTVGRMGGDEFIVLCEATDEEQARNLAVRLRERMVEPIVLDGSPAVVDLSIGIALGRSGDSAEELLRKADTALYRAKDAGRGRYDICRDGFENRAVRRFAIETRLREALKEASLDVAYQPVVNLASGRMTGAEALVRWTDGELGVVLPEELLPVAEDSGLIKDLGAFVLDRACAMRQDVPGPMTIAVNVSAAQLAVGHLLRVVTSALDGSGMAADDLVLELTETALSRAVSSAARELAELRGMGVRVAIDDFGTGWSSFTRLRDLPIDMIKIDRSFISGLGQGSQDDAIVAGIISMARAMGLETVAEGVETPLQLLRIIELGCGQAQGFLLSRPISELAVLNIERHKEVLLPSLTAAQPKVTPPSGANTASP